MNMTPESEGVPFHARNGRDSDEDPSTTHLKSGETNVSPDERLAPSPTPPPVPQATSGPTTSRGDQTRAAESEPSTGRTAADQKATSEKRLQKRLRKSKENRRPSWKAELEQVADDRERRDKAIDKSNRQFLFWGLSLMAVLMVEHAFLADDLPYFLVFGVAIPRRC